MSIRKGTLTERQKKFVEAYLICGNYCEAARRAGFKSTYAQGALRHPSVQKYLEKRRKEIFGEEDFTKEVVAVIARVAAGDVLAAEELPSLCEFDKETNKLVFKEKVLIAAEEILKKAAGV